MRKHTPIKDESVSRPKNLREAKLIIRGVMQSNNWDADEQRVYQNILGISGFDTEADVRKTIEDLEKSRMVIFKD